MPHSLRLLLVLLVRSVHSRRNLLLENLALRQQLGVLKRRHPQPRFAVSDKLFGVILRRLWPGWKRALILVRPDTLFAGIVQGSNCIGRGFRGIGPVRGENALAGNCAS